MPNMLDTIKSYLVSLGFEVDNTSYNQTKQALRDVDKVVSRFSGNTVKQFAIAGTAVTSFFVAANVGIAKYIEGLAKADLKNDMFARRMWMSKDNAVAYKNTLSALGAELQDLYLSPELLERYRQLRSQAGQLAAPGDYDDQMKQIRDVIFEFQRFKLEVSYASQWVGYYLSKYLEKPLSDIRKAMKDFNDNASEKMPKWTKQIAQVLSWVVRLGSAGVWGIKQLVQLFDDLSPKTKIAGGALLGLFTLIKMGPIGWLIAGVTALLLLMDDFKTYEEGGDSYFGDMWEQVDGLKQALQDDGTFTEFKESLDDIATSLGNIITDCADIANRVAQGLGFKDFASMLKTGVLNTIHELADLMKSIAGALETIDGILSGDPDKMKNGFEKFAESANNSIFGRERGGAINQAANQAGSGDVKGAAGTIGEASKDYWLSSWMGEDLANDWIGNINDTIIQPIKDLFTKHADGGIQTTPHLGWVAEEHPESIIPLDPNKRQNALRLLSQTAGILGAPTSGTMSNTINNIYLTNSPNYKVYGSEPTATARAIDRNNDYGILIRNLKGVIG